MMSEKNNDGLVRWWNHAKTKVYEGTKATKSTYYRPNLSPMGGAGFLSLIHI